MAGSIITLFALMGGQGKTTFSIMLARKLSRMGISTLLVDADPQASLTTFLGVQMTASTPSLLEVLTKENFPVLDTISPVNNIQLENKEIDNSNLFVIPSDNSLDAANISLGESGRSLFVLRERLSEIIELFGAIIVDAPPQRSHLALTTLGASDKLIVPVECTTKGAYSLERTLKLVTSQMKYLHHCTLLGIVPFRAKWTGFYPTHETTASMDAMRDISTNMLGAEQKMFPPLLESEFMKKAMNKRVLPSDIGGEKVETAINAIAQVLLIKAKEDILT